MMNFTKADRQAGRKKMEANLTDAARVRREFRSGRLPKTGDALPLHPAVVWLRAWEALNDFRSRMAAAKLNPADTRALIVYVSEKKQDAPRFLLMESKDQSTEQLRDAALRELLKPDVMALGMVFRQFDRVKQVATDFPFQFTGLSPQGVELLKKAVLMEQSLRKMLDQTN
jgi:hypothetical protein